MIPRIRDGHDVAMHRVTWGDTLPSISLEYYGTTHFAQEIWELNRHTIQTPNSLTAGMDLILPRAEVYRGSPVD